MKISFKLLVVCLLLSHTAKAQQKTISLTELFKTVILSEDSVVVFDDYLITGQFGGWHIITDDSIMQGLIGWFMLSIFTVALINQMLA